MQKTVKQRVRERLKKQARTQGDLAKAIGLSESGLSELLSGKRRMSLDRALALEAETGIPARQFAEVA